MNLNYTYCKAIFVLVKISFFKFYLVGPKVKDFNSYWFWTYVVVFALGYDFLFKSSLGHYVTAAF